MFIASCPECGDSLTFPSGVALSSRCRCPLCTETFTLEDCLSELPPMAEVLEGAGTGSGLSPAYGGGGAALATAPRAATASRVGTGTAGPRTAGRAPAKRAKGGNPLVQMAQIVIGGAVGVSLAILIIWWFIGTDPFGLAPTVAQYAPFLVPEKFKTPSVPENSNGTAPSDDAPAPKNPRRQQGVQLDGSRFATEEEQPSTPDRDQPRTSLDPDAGELSPIEPEIEAFSPNLGGAFSAVEEPSLEDFALPGSASAPQEPQNDGGLIDSEPSAPTLEEPMEEATEPGAFELEPLVDPTGDPLTADPLAIDPSAAAASDPFSLVFPTATEDLPEIAAAESAAWEAFASAPLEPRDVKRKLAAEHYDQLAMIAQTLAGLPPAPRSSEAAQEATTKLADRFDEVFERRVANMHAAQRVTNADFGMAGIVLAGRVAEVTTEGETAIATLTIEEGGSDAIRRVVAVLREAQGIPEKDSLVVVYGIRHAGDREALPASLADEKAPIVLAGAVAPVEQTPALEPFALEETPATGPEPIEPATEEPTPTEPSSEEPAASDAPTEPASEEPSAEEPAPASEPSIEEVPGEEPAPAAVEDES